MMLSEAPSARMEGDEDQPLKLVFIPYLAAGHMIPLCDIALMFASRGHHATIITTPSNAHIFDRCNPFPGCLHTHTVEFPSHQVGLPDGIENMTVAADLANSSKIYKASALLQGPIHHFLQQHPPDCIIADFMYPWISDLANKLRIPRLAFNGFSLFAVCAMESIFANPQVILDSGLDSFDIPNLPHQITMTTKPPKRLSEFLEPVMRVERKSYGLIVNNYMELDGEEYIKHYENTTGHKAWHVGPACLVRRSAKEKAERGHQSVVSELEYLSWLKSKGPNSVLYISFGSICLFPDKQLYEIACGIEAAGHKFIWVVPEKRGKEKESEEEKHKWLPEGFEERTMKAKGLIIRGWVPQVQILGHPAIGAFLTHCGWNSTLEAVSAGVPMITWPTQGDQFFNEKLITHFQGIGVEVGAKEWGYCAFGDRDWLVTRDQIENAVRRLMDGGDEATQIRKRAQELGKKAEVAVQEGGSSHKNLTTLINDLKQLRDSSKVT